MSRSGYSDDCDSNWELIKWRGAVASAIRGRRGQAFLREMLAALDSIPAKRLISHDLVNLQGVCAFGAVGLSRGLEMPNVDPYDWDDGVRNGMARLFGIAPALAAEIMFENDEAGSYWREETPEHRWQRVRAWVEGQIK